MPEEQLKAYSLKEVSEHSEKDSVWLLINNFVYDVTNFLEEHPGGSEVLEEYAGKEATNAFEDIGHSSDARELMKKYRIGELIESERDGKSNANDKPSATTSKWCVLQ